MGGDCWFVLALKLSWQTVWPNLTPLLYDTSILPAGPHQFSRITFWLELKLSLGTRLSWELHKDTGFPLVFLQ